MPSHYSRSSLRFPHPNDQEPLQPAKTNQTRTAVPPDTKKAKTGVENKVEGSAGGGKGAGKGATTGKAKKAAPKSAGKQASMMSFFKKA